MTEHVDHPKHYGDGPNDPYEAKTCSSCEQAKALADFPPDARRKDGRGSKCRPCARAASEAYYSRYPAKEAERRQRNAEHGRAWHQRNREQQIDRMRWTRSSRLYGLSRGDYERLLEQQGGRCAICRTNTPGRGNRYFAVDHDHDSGEVRGLLCQRCNSGLGFFGESAKRMREAAEYVERYERQRQAGVLHKVAAGAN